MLAASWVSLIVAAPLLWTPLAGVLYAVGSLICHQLPERSFHLHGFQLPVCGRCLGLYGGAALGSAVGATAGGRRALDALRGARGLPLAWWITAFAAVPTLVTVVVEWGVGGAVSNATRAIAAVPLGFAAAFVVVGALATLHYE
jgi:uncharacterized membrane protein